MHFDCPRKVAIACTFKIALLAFKACLPAYKYDTTMISSFPPVQSMRPRETKIFAFLLAIIIFVVTNYFSLWLIRRYYHQKMVANVTLPLFNK